jgi:CheY-like chemotaxis protein
MHKILLIDTDADVLTVLTWYLSKANLEVTCAGDGPKGLRRAREDQPDLIVLGTTMDDMDGFELAEQLRRDPLCHHIPILAYTSFATYRRRLRAADVGVARFVTRPYFLRDLVPVVLSMTGRRIGRRLPV